MLSREERILSEILVSRGLVERALVEECARELKADREGSSLADLIVQRGAADRAVLSNAEAEARELDRALAPALPQSGRLGEFRLIREIGRGGMGIVYEAEQEPLGRRVALKVLPALAALDERRAVRFLREARAAARLYHPGIVPVHASGISEGVLFFAMELIEGDTVADVIARGPVPPQRAAAIAAEVARALAHAHDSGLVHRDIKPENILLGRDGHARVADFGLVQESVPGSLTLSHHVLGTPAYLAPEQALGEEVDARADIYSLGAVLYTMLCGEPPYRGEVPAAVIGRLLHEDPPPLSERSRDLPTVLTAICGRAMARDRKERYQSAQSMAEALDSFLSDATPFGRETIGAPRRASSVRRVVVIALFAVAAVAGIAATILGPIRRSREPGAAPAAFASRAVPMKGDDCCARPGEARCKQLDLDLSSGVDDAAPSPGPIPFGEADSDWWVTADPNGGTVPRPAEVVKPHPRWKDIPGSRWISANVFGRNGQYVYEICFCVAPGVRSPVLDLAILSDDFATAARLNGRPFPMPAPPTCSYDTEPCRMLTRDASWFVSGRNCLVVEVGNVGGSPNGLLVSANVRGEY